MRRNGLGLMEPAKFVKRLWHVAKFQLCLYADLKKF